MSAPARVALTVDLEDWHQLVRRRATGEWGPPCRDVIADTHRALDLLDESHSRATFFVVGSVAQQYPALVREVAQRGHEVGSHTFRHRRIYEQTREDFRAEVLLSKAILEDLTGAPVPGFRAPEFSVGSLGHWCFEVLAESGFTYDSSVFPVAGVRYGVPGAPPRPFRIETPGGTLTEYPLATWEVAGRRLPVAGGSFLRALPAALLRRAMQQATAGGTPAVMYVHPYELHAGWLALDDLTWHARLKPAYLKLAVLHNLGTARILPRLRAILHCFNSVPLRELGDI